MAEPIYVTQAPFTIPVVVEVAQLVHNVIECMDVRHMFFLRFGVVDGMEGWCPRVTIVPSLTGQHDMCAVFIDASIECLSSAERAHHFQGKHWQHWTSNTAFSRRDAAIHQERFADLVRLRFTNAMSKPERWRLITLGEIDQVSIFADDELPFDDVEPDAVVTLAEQSQ